MTAPRKFPSRFARWLATPIFAAVLVAATAAAANPGSWKYSWPKTDFSKHAVDFGEIMSGGPPKDGIPSIDAPNSSPSARPRTCPTPSP